MANSMTGFGRAGEILGGREITVELRAVNHRYFEVSARIPRAYAFLEEAVKPYLQQRIARGKVDVGLQIQPAADRGAVIEPNMEAARGYAEALREIGLRLGLAADITVETLARFPDVFRVVSETPDEEALWQDVKTVLDRALLGFFEMRGAEGARMTADILMRLSAVERTAERIEADAPEQMARYREKLRQRMRQVLESAEIDENRILLEAAVYADKSAVDEETVRLKSHIAQFREILGSGGAIGRKLDFLVQELNREINTIGSKSADIGVTGMVVDAKAEIEKIREQIQNIE